jgi:release factor glutamine methyltransferase
MQIKQALQQAHNAGVARLDAQLLVAHLLEQPRAWLLAHDEHVLDTEQGQRWSALLARRAAGEPLAYVIGEIDFCGLRLHVSPAVLVPRPETELLVNWALEFVPKALGQGPRQAPFKVLDLGTGSGAIALAIQQARPAVLVSASDASADALAVAQMNARRHAQRQASNHALPLLFHRGDWWSPFVGQQFDLVVSNPPYVAGDDAHLAALTHEPRVALTPEGDGLSALKRIVQGAPPHLLPGAWLLLEHGHDQAQAVMALLHAAGFSLAQTRRDLAGLPRCTGARWDGL